MTGPHAHAHAHAPPRLLVVDDNATLVDNLTEILQDAGYSIRSAGTCAAGLAVEVSEAGATLLIETLVAFAANMTSPYARLNVFQVGGAIQRYDEQAMAVSHRNAKYVISMNTGWADPKDTEKQVQWTRDLWTAVRPFSLGGVYVNFLSADDGEERVRAAYGAAKYERLVQLKCKYDPHNLFQLNQNIKPVM